MLTVRDLGDTILYLGAVAGAAAAIGVLLRFLVVRPVQRWMRDIATQVKPNGGPQDTTRHLIEQTAGSMEALREEMRQQTSENRQTAQQALTLAQQANDRLDRHLESGTSAT